MWRSLVLGCLALSSAACSAPPRTTPGTVLLDWLSPQRFVFDPPFTQGEAIGEDDARSATVLVEPLDLRGGAILDAVSFDVTYVVGERRMHGFDGTTFTARVPLQIRIAAATESPWATSARCDDRISTPLLAQGDHPVAAFHDRTFFWSPCWISLTRDGEARAAPLTIYGDGQMTTSGPDEWQRVTIVRGE